MKESNKGKNIVIVLLILTVAILLGVIIYMYMSREDVNHNLDDNDNNNLSIKIDNNLDYVYDANYSYHSKYVEFNRFNYENVNETRKIDRFGIEVEFTVGMQYLSNLKVPYININTYSAGQVNKELENLYLEYVKNFDSCAEDAKTFPEGHSCSQILTYRTFLYNDVLSVVVINSTQATSSWVLDYNVYNFDLITGKNIGYDEILERLNYEKEATLNKTRDLIKEKMNSLYGESHNNDLSNACYKMVGSLESEKVSCYDIAYDKLEKSIEDNTIMFFVDNDGVLNILAIPYYQGIQNADINYYLIEVQK